jgi:DNA helicase-2/ATP-dependent DNA helicase PcrA
VLAGARQQTKILTSRIAHLVKNKGSPSNILAVAFTNKAASEIRRGLPRSWRQDQGDVRRTFHTAELRILQEEAKEAGKRPAHDIRRRRAAPSCGLIMSELSLDEKYPSKMML